MTNVKFDISPGIVYEAYVTRHVAFGLRMIDGGVECGACALPRGGVEETLTIADSGKKCVTCGITLVAGEVNGWRDDSTVAELTPVTSRCGRYTAYFKITAVDQMSMSVFRGLITWTT